MCGSIRDPLAKIDSLLINHQLPASKNNHRLIKCHSDWLLEEDVLEALCQKGCMSFWQKVSQEPHKLPDTNKNRTTVLCKNFEQLLYTLNLFKGSRFSLQLLK